MGMVVEANCSIQTEIEVLLALKLTDTMGNRRIYHLHTLLANHGYSFADLILQPPLLLYKKIPDLVIQFNGILEVLQKEKIHQAQHYRRLAEKLGLQVLSSFGTTYPSNLKNYLRTDAPVVLFLLGNINLLAITGCGVVGTRSPSMMGIKAARYAAQTIVRAGHCVISGGAFGVDVTAHDTALAENGCSIAFLPQGLLTYRLSKAWRHSVNKGRLLLVSEFFPDAPWMTYAAITRNALIAAQSQILCVVEPREKGGSLHTFRHALAQGKPVFSTMPEALPITLRKFALPFESLDMTLASLQTDLPHASGPLGQQDFFESQDKSEQEKSPY